MADLEQRVTAATLDTAVALISELEAALQAERERADRLEEALRNTQTACEACAERTKVAEERADRAELESDEAVQAQLTAETKLAELDAELTATPRNMTVLEALYDERRVWFETEAKLAALVAWRRGLTRVYPEGRGLNPLVVHLLIAPCLDHSPEQADECPECDWLAANDKEKK